MPAKILKAGRVGLGNVFRLGALDGSCWKYLECCPDEGYDGLRSAINEELWS